MDGLTLQLLVNRHRVKKASIYNDCNQYHRRCEIVIQCNASVALKQFYSQNDSLVVIYNCKAFIRLAPPSVFFIFYRWRRPRTIWSQVFTYQTPTTYCRTGNVQKLAIGLRLYFSRNLYFCSIWQLTIGLNVCLRYNLRCFAEKCEKE